MITPARLRVVAAFAALLAPFGAAGAEVAGAPSVRSPLDCAVAVARVVVRDASFAVASGPWQPTQAIQVVDFGRWDARRVSVDGAASATLTVATGGPRRFGVAGCGTVRIRIDDTPVATRAFAEPSRPIEYAYDRFRWPESFVVALAPGVHRIRVDVTPNPSGARFFLQACHETGERDAAVTFGDANAPDWLVADEPGGWRPHRRPAVLEFALNRGAVFPRHSLVEWHYATGVTHLAILEAAGAAAAPDLRRHVDRLVQVTLENEERFRSQYEEDHAWRGANYRLFRHALLDDTAAPALPFAELVRRGERPDAARLVGEIERFVRTRHPRLGDGTLCRDEPEPHTVWADDLFMATAFLVRLVPPAEREGWGDILRQFENFHRHLLDPATGLYWHGRYTDRGEPAGVRWARANGWMAWAAAECLRFLPADHPGRAALLARHRQHLVTLLTLQAPSGLWHQVLDLPDTFEETSATAMFTLALARGVNGGWLEPAVFAEPARRGWTGVQGRIGADGVVRGICGGTAIGPSPEYYQKRPTPPHDPRGIGAVIVAALEIANLESRPRPASLKLPLDHPASVD